jgi:hypothetical protein
MPSPNDPLIQLYQRHADAYDRLRGRALMERHWLDRFAALPASSTWAAGWVNPSPSTCWRRATGEGEPLYHASLDAAEYRRLLAEQGFVVQDHVVEDPDCGGHTVWLAARA